MSIQHCSVALLAGGSIFCEITGKHENKRKNGLEVLGRYKVNGLELACRYKLLINVFLVRTKINVRKI